MILPPLVFPALSDVSGVKGKFRLLILMTNFGHRSDFKPLKLVTCLISDDRKFYIGIGSVADLKIKNFEIVNINININTNP